MKERSRISRDFLESLYRQYNRKEFVHPDPLEFLYDFVDLKDREIAALIASSLAYGRVAQILKSVSTVLGKMEPSPYRFLKAADREDLQDVFIGFKHRFTTGQEIAEFLFSLKKMYEKYGTLYSFFLGHLVEREDDLLGTLCSFVGELQRNGLSPKNSLIASPECGSACKRLNLFLRWMIRKDRVDPGGWSGLPRSKLIVPLDTHMHKISLKLGFTKRKQADLKTALEITKAFRKIFPSDPVRYDFTLTRFGIRENDLNMLYRKCGL